MGAREHEEVVCDQEGRCTMMDDEMIEAVAEKAAERAIEKLTARVYQEVGRSVVSKLFYIIGACTIGLYFWLKLRGTAW